MEEENITATGSFVRKKKDGVILACVLLIDYEQVLLPKLESSVITFVIWVNACCY